MDKHFCVFSLGFVEVQSQFIDYSGSICCSDYYFFSIGNIWFSRHWFEQSCFYVCQIHHPARCSWSLVGNFSDFC